MTENTINNDRTMGGATGTLLAGRYRVVRQLGQGGMGSVWLAEDTKLDGFKVAIKMLPSVLVNNKRAYAQVKAEALVSLKLSHSNIATVRAFEEESGSPFLVMDYIDGQTLDDYLAEHCVATASSPSCPAGLPEEEVIRLLKPVAAALDYAHTQGVVHRDVKPGNIMIRKDGTPFVLDFGIAREIQETMTRVTGKLSSGTLLYMSPEQLHGAAPKPAQDIYSFAAMAYECLKGEPPFVRGGIEDQIKNKKPEPLGPQFSNCATGVMAGLEKAPEVRPATCAAVLDADDSDAKTMRFKKIEEQNDWCSKTARRGWPKCKLCKYSGIPIYMDNSFWMPLLLIFLLGFTDSEKFSSCIGVMLGLVIAVALHEFGYALIIKQFGYQVNDITLSLFGGGVRSLVALPGKMWQKILTALAWPLVCGGLSLLMFKWWLMGRCIRLFGTGSQDPVVRNIEDAILMVFLVNVLLFGLNLLPGLPMDGGHIFRGTLQAFTSRSKATFVAMLFGRAFAILIACCGVMFILDSKDFCGWRIGLVIILVAWMIWKCGNCEYQKI